MPTAILESPTMHPTSSDLILKASGVNVYYGESHILRDVDLQIPKGEMVCLIGRNGVGKTTFLKTLIGLLQQKSGSIEYESNQLLKQPPYRRARHGIGYVSQGRDIIPRLTVRENLMLGMEALPGGMGKNRRIDPFIYELFPILEQFLNRRGGDLSGGQQQRVALARALARQPRVMLLDEPFSGLDARLRDEIRSSTVKLLRKAGVATVMVTHDPVEAMAVADRISVIHDGRIEQTGEPEELYSRPVNHRVATSLGEANLVESVVQQGVVQTPLGAVAASRFQEGDQVSVLFRPESLSVTQQPKEDSTPVKLRDVRFLGDRTRVEVETECGVILFAAVPMQQAIGLAAEVHLAMMATPAVVERNDSAASKHAS